VPIGLPLYRLTVVEYPHERIPIQGIGMKGRGVGSKKGPQRTREDDPMTTAIRHDAEWRSASACRQANPDLFFPIATASIGRAEQTAKAKAMCARCPVRSQCLEFAQVNDLNYGIWGGTTPEDRVRIRRREQRAARARARQLGRSSSPV